MKIFAKQKYAKQQKYYMQKINPSLLHVNVFTKISCFIKVHNHNTFHICT